MKTKKKNAYSKSNDFVKIDSIKITGINNPVLQIQGTSLKENITFYLVNEKGIKTKANTKPTKEKNTFYIFHGINKKDKKFRLIAKLGKQEYVVETIKTRYTKRLIQNIKNTILNLLTDTYYEYNDFIGINSVKITGINNPVLQIKGTITKEQYEFYLIDQNGQKRKASTKEAEKQDDFYIFQEINKKDKKFMLLVKIENKEYYVAMIKTRYTKRLIQNIKTTILNLFTDTYYEYNDFIGINSVKITGINNPVLQIKGTITKEQYEFYLVNPEGEKRKVKTQKNKDNFFIFQEIDKKEKKITVLVETNGKEYYVLTIKNKMRKRIFNKIKSLFFIRFCTVTPHEDIVYTGLYLEGVVHPRFTMTGFLKKEEKEFEMKCNNQVLDFNKVPVANSKEFFHYIDLKKEEKDIYIYYGKDLVLRVKNRMYLRFINKIFSIIRRIIKKVVHIIYVFYRGIRASWKQYHFLIPPRLWKKYWIEFKNKMKSSENGLFYNMDLKSDYNKWLKIFEKEEPCPTLKYNPLISILIPVYNIDKEYLLSCVHSILNQTYTNFEICLVDDASTKEETIETLNLLKDGMDDRIKVKFRQKNGHISNTTNDALKMAKGEFIGLVDNDDLLIKNALYEVVKVLNKNKKLDFIYSDEDKMDKFEERCYPHFKPDFSPDTLLSCNYICHFSVIRKSIVNEVGGFEVGLEGAQDHDLFLKVTEKTQNIYHIPKILYHWRMIEGSTSATLSNKSYAQDKGRIVIENALKRRKIVGTVEKDISGYYRINYTLKKEPLISIIIPTKDFSDVLDKCLKSLYEKTTYKNYEVLVVNNNSSKEETFQLFEKYKKEHKNFKVIDANFEFNYSKINNLAVEKAKGEFIVLLNNDTEIITPEWLNIMVGYASQKHIGAVGAKLLYPDKTVQHGGVLLGVGGVASHAYLSVPQNNPGHYGRLKVPYNYSAVTAACLMVEKAKFLKVGGLEEKLKVAYNDVDFNLKLVKKGLYNLLVPQVELFHYESKSRGYDTTTEKYERFLKEQDFMYKKWGKEIEEDKMYNPNFSKKGPFVLDKQERKKSK